MNLMFILALRLSIILVLSRLGLISIEIIIINSFTNIPVFLLRILLNMVLRVRLILLLTLVELLFLTRILIWLNLLLTLDLILILLSWLHSLIDTTFFLLVVQT